MIFVKRLFVIVIFVSVFGVGISQETDNKPLRPIINSTMLELGRTGRLYDSYLSMIGYAGFNVGLSNERLQMARWGKNKVLSQQMVSLNYASTRNEAQNGKMITSSSDDYTFYVNDYGDASLCIWDVVYGSSTSLWFDIIWRRAG